MKCVIVFGPPGAGKGTQSKLLSEKFNLRHISTGDIIRAEIKSGSDLGQRAADMIKGGNLLDDKTVIAISEEALQPNKLQGFNGYILDGYPRTVEQAKAVKEFAKNNGHDILPIICLTADETIITERIKSRGIRAGESDNVAEETANRIRVYEEQTKPVLDFFNEEFAVFINSNANIEKVFENIQSALTTLKDPKRLPVD